MDHDDRRLDAGQVRRAHAGLCRDAHVHLGGAVDQVGIGSLRLLHDLDRREALRASGSGRFERRSPGS